MPQKIYFGDVEVKDSRNGNVRTIKERLYKEKDSLQDASLRNYVLKGIPHKERSHFKIVRLCFDTAKQIGETVY